MTWAPDYTTSAALKRRLQIDTLDTTNDLDIALAITAASRAIDRHCNRQFGRVASPTERIYTAQYNQRRRLIVIPIDDLMPVTGGLVVEVDAGTVTDYTLEPVNAAADGMPFTRIAVNSTSTIQPTCVENGVSITTPDWGWSAIPPSVENACLIQSHRFVNRKDSPYGIEGSPQTEGGELRILARLDADVKIMLTNYVRPRRNY